MSHHAVFAGHRHDVGGDADGNQIEQVVEVVTTVEPVALRKGLHKLKTHTAAGKVRVGVGVALQLRVEDGARIG